MMEQSGKQELGPLKKGYLIKKGDIVKSWKRRWFMLTHQGEIYYMVNEDSTMPKGTIKLSDVSEVVDGDGLHFTLKTPSRNYDLRAEKEQDKTDWIATIQEAKDPKQVASEEVEPAAVVEPPDLNTWQMWTAEQTGQWIASLGLPEYRDGFIQAKVIGSLLQSITPHQLKTVCGIENEEHQWKVLAEIQTLVVSNLQFGTPMLGGGMLG